ncbi:helix-turn-helix domain-containing protein [Chryseobacterium sp. PMSZPI]|uniref:helix-turn-helix domain-containing protein n=1 Tax=Chryseobacterium sp. PMSZPI TaxID=1033900 RepID=UPI000C31C461|nr:helix-turn-helix transcriptional regulator [Chryseobacterium sp. PMSZPI]PKF76177.1 hypothetical protein CW752_00900 [Chryseobacterium sp. PMSZPI]
MILKKTFCILLFFCLKFYAQDKVFSKESLEIDNLIKKDKWDLVHLKLNNENINFQRVSKYDLKYHLLIKLDSASVLYRKGKYEESKQAVLTTLDEIQHYKNKLGLTYYEGLKQMGIARLFYIEKRSGNIVQAVKYLNSFSQGMSPIYRKKQTIFYAVAYMELGNYEKGIEMLNARLKNFHEDQGNHLYNSFIKKQEVAATYNTKGEAFIKWYKDTGNKGLLDSAQNNFNKAYGIVKDSSYSKSLNLCWQAEIVLLRKQYHHSQVLFNRCEKDAVLMSRNFSREAVWLGKAEIYTFTKKTDSAFHYINKLYDENSFAKNTSENKLKIYYLLSINYENLDDSKNAYKFAKLSLSEMEKKKQQNISSRKVLGLYEQQEIKSSAKEMIQEDHRQIFLWIGLILIIGLMSSAAFFIYFKRKKKTGVEQHAVIIETKEELLSEKNNGTTALDNELVARILRKLEGMEVSEKFLSNNFKLANVTKQLNTNTAYLSQIINQYKGVSFSEYVNNLRIHYVLTQLKESPKFRRYTIRTMAEEVGYKSSTTFIKAFKDRLKMTPSDYIKQLENDPVKPNEQPFFETLKLE